MASEQWDHVAKSSLTTPEKGAEQGEQNAKNGKESTGDSTLAAKKKAAIAKDRTGDALQQAGGEVKESLENVQSDLTLGNR